MSVSFQQLEAPQPIDVLGLPIRPLRTAELIGLLVHRARAGVRTTVCYANAHTVNLARRNRRFHAVLSESDVLYADGASVVWASRWSERRLPERLTAVDYFARFARHCAEADLSIYLLGGRDGIADAAAGRLRSELPSLRVAGTRHGCFDASASDDVVAAINDAAPDVLAVGMSSPRQEFWLAEHSAALKVPLRWCVGALFDYFAGQEPRAPAWLCRLGGEWLFRLLMDPIGKWRRYVIGNPQFVLNVLRWRLQGPVERPRRDSMGAAKTWERDSSS